MVGRHSDGGGGGRRREAVFGLPCETKRREGEGRVRDHENEGRDQVSCGFY